MPPPPRLRDAQGLYLLDYTDKVIDHKTKTMHRVVDFHFIEKIAADHYQLVFCLPEDPRMSVISTTGVSGHIFRPWQIAFGGFIPWEPDFILSQRTTARDMVSKRDSRICSQGYPGLFDRLGRRESTHELISIQKWKRDTSNLIARFWSETTEAEADHHRAPIPSALS